MVSAWGLWKSDLFCVKRKKSGDGPNYHFLLLYWEFFVVSLCKCTVTWEQNSHCQFHNTVFFFFFFLIPRYLAHWISACADTGRWARPLATGHVLFMVLKLCTLVPLWLDWMKLCCFTASYRRSLHYLFVPWPAAWSLSMLSNALPTASVHGSAVRPLLLVGRAQCARGAPAAIPTTLVTPLRFLPRSPAGISPVACDVSAFHCCGVFRSLALLCFATLSCA